MNRQGIVWLLKELFHCLHAYSEGSYKAKAINATEQMLMSASTLWSVVNKARQEGAMLDSSALHAGITNDTYCKDIEYITIDGDQV